MHYHCGDNYMGHHHHLAEYCSICGTWYCAICGTNLGGTAATPFVPHYPIYPIYPDSTWRYYYGTYTTGTTNTNSVNWNRAWTSPSNYEAYPSGGDGKGPK